MASELLLLVNVPLHLDEFVTTFLFFPYASLPIRSQGEDVSNFHTVRVYNAELRTKVRGAIEKGDEVSVVGQLNYDPVSNDENQQRFAAFIRAKNVVIKKRQSQPSKTVDASESTEALSTDAEAKREN